MDDDRIREIEARLEKMRTATGKPWSTARIEMECHAPADLHYLLDQLRERDARIGAVLRECADMHRQGQHGMLWAAAERIWRAMGYTDEEIARMGDGAAGRSNHGGDAWFGFSKKEFSEHATGDAAEDGWALEEHVQDIARALLNARADLDRYADRVKLLETRLAKIVSTATGKEDTP